MKEFWENRIVALCKIHPCFWILRLDGEKNLEKKLSVTENPSKVYFPRLFSSFFNIHGSVLSVDTLQKDPE